MKAWKTYDLISLGLGSHTCVTFLVPRDDAGTNDGSWCNDWSKAFYRTVERQGIRNKHGDLPVLDSALFASSRITALSLPKQEGRRAAQVDQRTTSLMITRSPR